MKLSYKKLWIKLVELDMNKSQLADAANISSASVSKLGKGTSITTAVLLKICEALNCDISEIVEVVNDDGSPLGKVTDNSKENSSHP